MVCYSPHSFALHTETLLRLARHRGPCPHCRLLSQVLCVPLMQKWPPRGLCQVKTDPRKRGGGGARTDYETRVGGLVGRGLSSPLAPAQSSPASVQVDTHTTGSADPRFGELVCRPLPAVGKDRASVGREPLGPRRRGPRGSSPLLAPAARSLSSGQLLSGEVGDQATRLISDIGDF